MHEQDSRIEPEWVEELRALLESKQIPEQLKRQRRLEKRRLENGLKKSISGLAKSSNHRVQG